MPSSVVCDLNFIIQWPSLCSKNRTTMHFLKFGLRTLLFAGSVHAIPSRHPSQLIVRTTCLPEYAASTTFVDCFKDNADERTLGTQLGDLEENDPQSYANQCGLAGYSYAGVEYTIQCFSSNQPPTNYGSISGTQVNVTQCDSPCPGNSSEFCGAGGRWVLQQGRRTVSWQSSIQQHWCLTNI